MLKLKETQTALLETALKGMQNAYVLWGFKVGAAVLAEDGQMYGGCDFRFRHVR
jgi:cytidine deaminase